MHEHFDIDGQPCIAAYAHTTVVTREPEWDEATRGRALRLAEHERSIDKFTGLPLVDAYADQPFLVHSDVVNYAQRALDRQQAEDEKNKGDDYEKWSKHRTYYVTVPDPNDLTPS